MKCSNTEARIPSFLHSHLPSHQPSPTHALQPARAMHRRDLLKTGSSAFALSLLLPSSAVWARGASNRLFFSVADLPRIRANARTPLLRPMVDAWKTLGTDSMRAAFDKAAASGDILTDFAAAMEALTREATLHLVEPSDARRDAVLYGIEAATRFPKWDYFLDGDAEIGIMRASLANTRLLFAREVLGPDLPTDLEARLLDAVAEKGTLPCYRTIVGMDHPESVVGWRFDDNHQQVYDIDLSRWPEILGANNLRAIPTMGLGMGALALRGHDDRAGLWLDTAVSSARHYLSLLSADGSYFEGLSYINYAFRTLLAFLTAHERTEGTVDWAREANFEGVARYIFAMQAGRNADGTPDIVNFSDANTSVFPCVPAWIAKQTGSRLAQQAVQTVSVPGSFLDLLWVEPERPTEAPPDSLKNARLDLDWVIARSGWEPDDAVLAFRSGNPSNHEHADRNSFFYKVHGERLLTDHFGAAYDWRQPKWLLRLTEAHNAVLIDGKGHQYHHGEEGTNASQARAEIVRFEDDGDRVWWSSDATQAYALVNPAVKRVRRTILFAKPDVVVLLDQIETEVASTAAVRFFPDNRDGAAAVDASRSAFTIRRPKATLHGRTVARSAFDLGTSRLDLDAEWGVFPYVEVRAAAAQRHEIVTVLMAGLAEDARPFVSFAEPDANGWTITAGDVRARIGSVDGGVALGHVPDVEWL